MRRLCEHTKPSPISTSFVLSIDRPVRLPSHSSCFNLVNVAHYWAHGHTLWLCVDDTQLGARQSPRFRNAEPLIFAITYYIYCGCPPRGKREWWGDLKEVEVPLSVNKAKGRNMREESPHCRLRWKGWRSCSEEQVLCDGRSRIWKDLCQFIQRPFTLHPLLLNLVYFHSFTFNEMSICFVIQPQEGIWHRTCQPVISQSELASSPHCSHVDLAHHTQQGRWTNIEAYPSQSWLDQVPSYPPSMRSLLASSGLRHICTKGGWFPSCLHHVIPTKLIIRLELEQNMYADSIIAHRPGADCSERISGLQGLLEGAPPLPESNLLWHCTLEKLLDGTRDGSNPVQSWTIETGDW